MEEFEQEEKKPIENWNGDERRRHAAANDGTDAVGVKPPIGDSDADEQEGR